MTDNQRILELKKTASKLGFRLHLISTDFDKGELEPTRARDMFGIVVIDDPVSNENAFWLQQHRYDNE